MASLTPLHVAAAAGDLEQVKNMVEAGGDIDQPAPGSHPYHGCSPLETAICNSKNIVAKYLLEKNCDVEYRSSLRYTPFLTACVVNNLEMVQLLHERGVNTGAVSDSQWTGLHLACYWGHNPVVQYILSHQLCHIDLMNKFGHTALHLAAGRGRPTTVDLLLQHQPRILKDHYGRTPLERATSVLEEIRKKPDKDDEAKRLMIDIPKCMELLKQTQSG